MKKILIVVAIGLVVMFCVIAITGVFAITMLCSMCLIIHCINKFHLEILSGYIAIFLCFLSLAIGILFSLPYKKDT